MEDNQRHIDDILREALGQYSETPPPAVWEDIARRLPPPRRRRYFPWWGWMIVLLLISSAGIFMGKAWLNKGADNTASNVKTAGSAASLNATKDNNYSIIKTDSNSANAAAGAAHKASGDHAQNHSSGETAQAHSMPAAHHSHHHQKQGKPAMQATVTRHAHTVAHAGSSAFGKIPARRHSYMTTSSAKIAALRKKQSQPAATDSAPNTIIPNDGSTANNTHASQAADIADRKNKPASGQSVNSRNKQDSNATHRHTTTTDIHPSGDDGTENALAPVSRSTVSKRTRKRNDDQLNAGSAANTAAVNNRISRTKSPHNNTENTASATADHPALKQTIAANPPARRSSRRHRSGDTNSAFAATQPNADSADAKINRKPGANNAARNKKQLAGTDSLTAKANTVAHNEHAITPKQKGSISRSQKPETHAAAVSDRTAASEQAASGNTLVKHSTAAAKNNSPAALRNHRASRKTDVADVSKPVIAGVHSQKTIQPAANAPVSRSKKTNKAIAGNKRQKSVGNTAGNATASLRTPVTKVPDTPVAIIPDATVKMSEPVTTMPQPKLTPQEANLLQPKPDDAGETISSGGGMDDASYKNLRKAHGLQWDAGVKAGYEKGFSASRADKIIAGPFIRFNLADNISVTFSPAYKYGSASSASLFGPASFYQVRSNTIDTNTTRDTAGVHYNYRFKQLYDSVIVSYKTGGKIWEVELPLTVGIRIARSLTLYAGPVFSFGSQPVITSANTTYHLSRQDSIINTLTPVPASYFNNYFAHPGQDSLGSLNTAPYQNAASDPVRLGYLAGLNFMFNRLMIDFSVQQSLSGYSGIPNNAVQQVYKQPYFRVGVGYSIFKSRPKSTSSE